MTANYRSRNIASTFRTLCLACALGAAWPQLGVAVFAQAQQPTAPPASEPPPAAAAAAPRPTDPEVPPGYVIGTDDVLSIVYWKDKDMSADAKVRPDGRIALPLINEVHAAGLTPEQLHQKLTEESKKYMEDANITVVVREINSRRVFITGEVNLSAVSWKPDSRGISFLAKRGKDEHRCLYVIPVDGGEARQALAFDTDIQSYSWSHDGKRLAFIASEKKAKEEKDREEKRLRDEARKLRREKKPRDAKKRMIGRISREKSKRAHQ